MTRNPTHGRALQWLFVIQLLSMGAMEMSGPFWPLHLRAMAAMSPQRLGWSSGIIYAGPLVMAMLFTPLWGRLSDRCGHRHMLLRALIALALTQWWIAIAGSIASLIAARLLQGALAGFIVAAQVYGVTLVAPRQRGWLMARLQVATACGSIAGPLAGGVLFDHYGFSSVNLLAGAICAACAVLAIVTLPATAGFPRPGVAAGPVSAVGPIAGLLIAIVLVQTGKMAPQVFFGVYAAHVLQASGWQTGLCYGATAFGLLLAAPLWGKRFDCRSEQAVLGNVEAVSWICAGIVMLQALTHQLLLFIALRVLWGICLGALLPVLYMLLSRHATADSQGRVLGFGNSVAKAGALLGLAVGSASLAWLPIADLFWPVALVYLIAALGLRLLRGTRRSALHCLTNEPTSQP